MSNNPINLGLRFILELIAWFAPGYWGWTQHEGLLRIVLGIGLPLIFIAVWGTFRVPNDPGDAPVAIPGWLRLIIEAAEFGGAVVLFWLAGATTFAIGFGVVTLLHYAVSYDRIQWLLTDMS